MKTPRLFYWEDALDAWCQPCKEVEEAIATIFDITDLKNGEIREVLFKRFDTYNEEYSSLKEE